MKKILYSTIILFLLFVIGFLTLGLIILNEQKQIVQKTNIKAITIEESVKEGKKLTIIFTPDIDNACKISVKTIGGCYIRDSSLIYINTMIVHQDVSYVLTHEIGHWLTEHKNMKIFDNDWEKAANSFSDWILNKEVDSETKEYFDKIWSDL